MRLHSPTSAVLSAVIFNALIIIALIPLALRGIALPAARRRRCSCAATCSSTASAALVAAVPGIKLDRPRPDGARRRAEIWRSRCSTRPPRAVAPRSLFTVLTGVALPARGHRPRAGRSRPRSANGSLVERGGRLVGSALDRPAVHATRATSGAAPRRPAPTPYNAGASTGSNLGPSNPALARRRGGARRGAPRRRPGQRRARAGRPRHRLRRAGSTRTSRRPRRCTRCGASRARAGSPSAPRPRAGRRSTSRAARSGSSASRASTCCALNLALDALRPGEDVEAT